MVTDVTSSMRLMSTGQPESSWRLPLRVWWRASDPAAVTALLERLGLRVAGGSVPLGSIVLSVVAAGEEDLDRLEVGDPVPQPTGGRDQDDPLSGGPTLGALGWATVDAERLAAALGKPLGDEGHVDPALGATGFSVRSASLPVVLLEPATEGRIAAALARLGEGPVALYLEGLTVGDDEDATLLARTGMGREGRLLRPARPSGPFVVALQP